MLASRQSAPGAMEACLAQMCARSPRISPVLFHRMPADMTHKEPLLVDQPKLFNRWTEDLQCQSSLQATWQGSLERKICSSDESRTGDAVVLRPLQRDESFWTVRISQRNKRGQGRQALSIYEDLLSGGLTPTSCMFVAALKACSSLQDLECAKRIHAEAVKAGLEVDIHVGTMLVHAYGKCGSLVEARRVFEKMPHRNVVSWTAMIFGYLQVDECQVALQLYARMQLDGAVPNERTFVCALKACSTMASKERTKGRREVAGNLEQVKAIHWDVLKGGFKLNAMVTNMLVDAYVKCGSLVDARPVFEEMAHRDVVSWTTMILGYVQIQEAEEALRLYERMQQDGVAPDKRAFLSALKALSSLCDSEQGNKFDRERECLEKVRAIHSQIVKQELKLDIYLGTMLVDVYAKCGSLVHAKRIFEQLPHRDVACWTAMILGYAVRDEGHRALMLYARMQKEGVTLDERAFVGVLKACGCIAALEKGKEVHAQISKAGVQDTDLFLANCLIHMYARCGSMTDAQQVFDKMATKDVVTWSSLIAGYSQQGDSEVVFTLVQNMVETGIQPNHITFVSILTACSHVGLVDKGQKYFDAMKQDFGISPGLEHYTCMIDLLGRTGHLHNAMAMATTMPCQADDVVWESVLAACQKWGNVELGRHAFDCAMRSNQENYGAYVLMSNIYAAAGMCEEAQNIRAMRLKVGGWKEPGRSFWTDTRGTVHAFVAGRPRPSWNPKNTPETLRYSRSNERERL